MRCRPKQYRGTVSRRSQIVRAALSCFTEMGYVDTTMEDIRARSGASNGSIYHHFKSKEQLAAAVYLEGIQVYQDGLMARLKECPGAEQGIAAVVGYHLSWVNDNRAWAAMLFSMRHADFMRDDQEEMIVEHNKRFMDSFSKWLAAHVRARRFRNMAPEIIVSLILGPCQEFSRHWLLKNRGPDMDTAIAQISSAVCSAVLSDSAAINTK